MLDCGDNSCMFARQKTGMRTNGGCRCLKDLDYEPERRRKVRAHIADLEQRLVAAEEERDLLRAVEKAHDACRTAKGYPQLGDGLRAVDAAEAALDAWRAKRGGA